MRTSGKGLGGSGAINFMVYTKPPKQELDGTYLHHPPQLPWSYESHPDWERLGNTGWNWESYQKALKKVEGYVAAKSCHFCVLSRSEDS